MYTFTLSHYLSTNNAEILFVMIDIICKLRYLILHCYRV